MDIDIELLKNTAIVLAMIISLFNIYLMVMAIYHMTKEKDLARYRDCIKDVVSALTWEFALVIGLYVYIVGIDFVTQIVAYATGV